MYVFKTQAWNTCIYRIVTWQCRQPDVHGVVLFVPLFYRMSVSASSITQRPLQEQHSMQALLVSAPGWAHPQETRPQQQRQTHSTPYSHLLKVPPALLLSSEREKHLACLCVSVLQYWHIVHYICIILYYNRNEKDFLQIMIHTLIHSACTLANEYIQSIWLQLHYLYMFQWTTQCEGLSVVHACL